MATSFLPQARASWPGSKELPTPTVVGTPTIEYRARTKRPSRLRDLPDESDPARREVTVPILVGSSVEGVFYMQQNTAGIWKLMGVSTVPGPQHASADPGYSRALGIVSRHRPAASETRVVYGDYWKLLIVRGTESDRGVFFDVDGPGRIGPGASVPVEPPQYQALDGDIVLRWLDQMGVFGKSR